MIEWLREILFSKSAFIGFARAILVGGGLALTTGQLPDIVPAEYGPWIAALGVFLRSTMPVTPEEARAAKKAVK